MKTIKVKMILPEVPEPDVPAEDLIVSLSDGSPDDDDFEGVPVADTFLEIVEGVQGGGGEILDEDMELLQKLFAGLDQSEKNAQFKYIVEQLDATDFQVHDFIDVLQDLCSIDWVWMDTVGEDDEVLRLREENAQLKVQIEELQRRLEVEK